MTAKHKELCATNAAAHKAWNTYKMVLTIIHDQAIDNIYHAFLDDPTKGLNAINSPTTPRSANLIWMTT
jgi:hypothetical protein